MPRCACASEVYRVCSSLCVCVCVCVFWEIGLIWVHIRHIETWVSDSNGLSISIILNRKMTDLQITEYTNASDLILVLKIKGGVKVNNKRADNTKQKNTGTEKANRARP